MQSLKLVQSAMPRHALSVFSASDRAALGLDCSDGLNMSLHWATLVPERALQVSAFLQTCSRDVTAASAASGSKRKQSDGHCGPQSSLASSIPPSGCPWSTGKTERGHGQGWYMGSRSDVGARPESFVPSATPIANSQYFPQEARIAAARRASGITILSRRGSAARSEGADAAGPMVCIRQRRNRSRCPSAASRRRYHPADR